MRPKKSMLKEYLIFFFILYCMVIYFALHYTIVSDLANGLTNLGSGIRMSVEQPIDNISSTVFQGIKVFGNDKSTNPIQLLFDTAAHIANGPFNFDGLIVTHVFTPLFGLTFFFVCALGLGYTHHQMFKQDAAGKEKGSAKWFTDYKAYAKEFVTPWTKKDQQQGFTDQNILLANGLKLSMDTRKTQRNLNVLAIGGSGTGKTFRFIKPNLAQMNCSFVTTDPSGEIMQVMGIPLMEHGYLVKLFSTSDMRHSNNYNPMDYIYDADGEINQTKVGVLVSTFIKNAQDLQKKGGGDPFWTKSSTAWMTFAVLFLARFAKLEERNMYSILKLAQSGKADENGSSETTLDMIVEEKRKIDPTAKCFSSYDTFKLAPAKTANSILISIAVDLNPFSMDDVRNMTTTSYICTRNEHGIITSYKRDKNNELIRDSKNLDLNSIGNQPTAVFINIPQANGAYNFLVSMMYSQLFDQLYSVAEKVSPNSFHIYDGRGDVLDSQFKTQDEATRMLELYKTSEVRKIEKDDVDHFYLYNKDADEETPLEYEADEDLGKGYIKEVYSEKVGNEFISRCNSMAVAEQKSLKLFGIIPLFNRRVITHKKSYVKQGKLRLPIHVRFLLDEFSNIGEVPNFDKMLSTMRKYEISCTIILQSLAQIKAQYDKVWEVLVGNCDSKIFLGSSENDTVKYMSETLGKATIRTIDTSQSQSSTSSSQSTSMKKDGRDLLDPAELAKLDNHYCIVVVRGLDPFYLKKLSFAEHPHFKETGDSDPTKIIGEKYLEEHFKCLPAGTIDQQEMATDENQNKDAYRDQKKINRNKDNKKAITSNIGKESMAAEMGTSTANLEKEMQNAESVPEKELQKTPNTDVIETSTPNESTQEERNSTENLSTNTTPNNNEISQTAVPQGLKSAATDNGQVGPEGASDDLWMYF